MPFWILGNWTQYVQGPNVFLKSPCPAGGAAFLWSLHRLLCERPVIRIPLNSCTVGTTPPVHPYREIRIFSYSFQSD
ncbi:hypothetical protein DVJ83_07150 [Deinococcus wulumuqiensis]|uniref:Uncharacterized protein n=1 Tax=Deinococcus wulumuqiensis TaxID=980427 RepID=A0A345IH03_9DEIO|nr:hypothetical protein DVJ83_07150 [Deinococcus wulumuqiensis]